MALDWEKMFKRYVFDEARTPQFIRVSKLSRTQAHYEVLFYALLVVPVAVLLGVISLSGKLMHGDQPMIALYALAAAWATIVFAWNKSQIAGTFSATLPLGLLIYLMIFGFPAKMTRGDSVLVTAIIVGWALYNWRIVMIAASYPDMIDRSDGPVAKPRRRPQDYFEPGDPVEPSRFGRIDGGLTSDGRDGDGSAEKTVAEETGAEETGAEKKLEEKTTLGGALRQEGQSVGSTRDGATGDGSGREGSATSGPAEK